MNEVEQRKALDAKLGGPAISASGIPGRGALLWPDGSSAYECGGLHLRKSSDPKEVLRQQRHYQTLLLEECSQDLRTISYQLEGRVMSFRHWSKAWSTYLYGAVPGTPQAAVQQLSELCKRCESEIARISSLIEPPTPVMTANVWDDDFED